jgi:hypothetical protein
MMSVFRVWLQNEKVNFQKRKSGNLLGTSADRNSSFTTTCVLAGRADPI